MHQMAQRVNNALNIEILTPTGFKPFSGVMKTKHDKHVKIVYENNSLSCSNSHRLKLINDTFIRAELTIGSKLATGEVVNRIDNIPGVVELYDLTDVVGNEYITNGIVSHNCELLSSDALLIDSRILQNRLKSIPPKWMDKGFKLWKEFDPKKTYIVGVDVAEGMEKDFSTIEVLELETMEQVAEFRDNKIKEDKLYEAIKWILGKIDSYVDPRTHKSPEVYWSFENNSAGAVIGALYRNDDKFPMNAQLISVGEKQGMRTTNKSKVEACRNIKNLIEKATGGITVKSESLIFELKNFIQRGASYSARDGATDDLICAFLIITRVLKYLSGYEQDVFDKIYKTEGDFYDQTTSEYSEPIPFTFT